MTTFQEFLNFITLMHTCKHTSFTSPVNTDLNFNKIVFTATQILHVPSLIKVLFLNIRILLSFELKLST